MEILDDPCPCLDCIVFAICNPKVQEETNSKLVIVGLAVHCPILMEYLTYNNTTDLDFANHCIDNARRVYGSMP